VGYYVLRSFQLTGDTVMGQTLLDKFVLWASNFTGISLSLSNILLALVAQLVLGLLLPWGIYFLIGLGWATGSVIQQRKQDPRWQKLVLTAVLNGVFFPVAIVLAWVREKSSL
jgi:hypothetical protein